MKAHRVWTAIIGVVIVGAGITIYQKTHTASAQTRYVLNTVQKSTLITSVAGTGQIASTNQVDIKPKVSGDITYVAVTAGQAVKAGAIIAKIDSTDAYKTYRDASENLTAAKIAYEKSVQSSQDTLTTTHDTLQKSYDDAFTTLSNVFTGVPGIFSDINDVINNSNHSPYLSNSNIDLVASSALDEKMNAGREFDAAKSEYDKNLLDFKLISRTSDPASIKSIVAETYQTVKDLSVAEKDLNDLLVVMKASLNSTVAQLTTDQTMLDAHITATNGYVSDLYTAGNTIATQEQALSQQSASLNGADTLDTQAAKLSLEQKQNAVSDAAQTLGYYTVRAPFDGVIGKVQAQVAGSAASGSALATIITNQSVADISLNEIDIAKVQTGQKVNVTFDALPDLTLTGAVAQVDQIGTVTQGVVSYNVEITFDTQDPRVKPGMSMSAAIITDAKPDVITVPTSAIKTTGGSSTVQVVTEKVDPAAASSQSGVVLAAVPQTVSVQLGSSNDTDTEITSGLNEGDVIVVRTVSGSTIKTTAATASRGGLFGTGAGGGASGAPRALRGN